MAQGGGGAQLDGDIFEWTSKVTPDGALCRQEGEAPSLQTHVLTCARAHTCGPKAGSFPSRHPPPNPRQVQVAGIVLLLTPSKAFLWPLRITATISSQRQPGDPLHPCIRLSLFC